MADDSQPYFTDKTTVLAITKIVDILKKPDDSKTVSVPPREPRGGEIYVYKVNDFEEGIWKKDKYYFRSDGKQKQPKLQPEVMKEFYKAYKEYKSPDKKQKTTKAFQKLVFYLIEENPKYVLVQYIGDHQRALDDPKVKKAQRTSTAVGSSGTSRENIPSYCRKDSGVVHGQEVCDEVQLSNESCSPDQTSSPSVKTGSLKRKAKTGVSESPLCKRVLIDGENNQSCDETGLAASTKQRDCITFMVDLQRRDDLHGIVTKILNFSQSCNRNPILDCNPCLSLIDEVSLKWVRDIEKVFQLLKITKPYMDLRGSNYEKYLNLRLIASVIVGAFHTEIDVRDYLETFKVCPAHCVDILSETECCVDSQYSIGRYTVRGQDLKDLDSEVWVTDDILDTYLHLLETERISQYCMVLPTETYLLWETGRDQDGRVREKESLKQHTWILMPINLPRNQHWVLLVANMDKQTVGVVNSKPGFRVEDKIMEHWRNFTMQLEVNIQWKTQAYKMIEQTDGHSCGIFVMMAAEAILAGVSPSVMRNFHARQYRSYIKQRILQNANINTRDAGESVQTDNEEMETEMMADREEADEFGFEEVERFQTQTLSEDKMEMNFDLLNEYTLLNSLETSTSGSPCQASKLEFTLNQPVSKNIYRTDTRWHVCF